MNLRIQYPYVVRENMQAGLSSHPTAQSAMDAVSGYAERIPLDSLIMEDVRPDRAYPFTRFTREPNALVGHPMTRKEFKARK